jgi:hypothetical protein
VRRPGAVRRHQRDRHGQGEPPPALLDQLAEHAPLVIPIRGAAAST